MRLNRMLLLCFTFATYSAVAAIRAAQEVTTPLKFNLLS